jgi:hypothetical protein
MRLVLRDSLNTGFAGMRQGSERERVTVGVGPIGQDLSQTPRGRATGPSRA